MDCFDGNANYAPSLTAEKMFWLRIQSMSVNQQMLFVVLSIFVKTGQFPAETVSSESGQPTVLFMSAKVIIAEEPFDMDSVDAAVVLV